MHKMSVLPAEIFVHVLLHVRSTVTQHAYLECLLTSRRWYSTGMPLLLAHVSISNFSALMFAPRLIKPNATAIVTDYCIEAGRLG